MALLRLLFILGSFSSAAASSPASRGSAAASSPASRDAAAVCASISLDDKLGMMHGYGLIDGYSRNSGCGDQCHRKTFRWDNGPQGFGDHTLNGTTTQWPSCLNMGATFDAQLASEWGEAMGTEFYNKGTNIQEGPGLNVARIMKNGRNFEYMSGEDPVLGATLVGPLVHGIQQNVMSIAKHYIGNTQETHRQGVNEVIDEVTLMELYGPPFAAAAKAGVAGYMCAYNRVNGVYACENEHTVNTMLKGLYGHDGFVVSDWGATHSTTASLQHGLDIEMPKGKYFTADKIKAAIAAGNITEAKVNDTCRRILTGYFRVPESKRNPGPCGGGICIDRNVTTAEHKALARKLSAMSTVLLKNDKGLLPLDQHGNLKIALIGPDAAVPYTAGQGSGSVDTTTRVSPLQAFKALAAGTGMSVTYDSGASKASAQAAAKGADVAFVFGSAHTGEGRDRPDLNLGGNIDEIILAVAQVKPDATVVVMSVPGSILTDWRDSVPAILTNFLPGEQVGPALADIVFGAIAPQAKLPVTFPNRENEQNMTEQQYPGVKDGAFDLEATYTEGQLSGYRWYDKNQVRPAFPFGHGLSYGEFAYSDLKVEGRDVSFKVHQVAGREGSCDTAQLYISYPTAGTDPQVPAKVLRHFMKTCEASTTVKYQLTDADVSNWDVKSARFVVTKGTFIIAVGSSSQDIRLTGSVEID